MAMQLEHSAASPSWSALVLPHYLTKCEKLKSESGEMQSCQHI